MLSFCILKWSKTKDGGLYLLLRLIAVPDLCCIRGQRFVESVGGVFDPLVCSAIPVFGMLLYHFFCMPSFLLVCMSVDQGGC